jgi:uncharacterized protein YdaU (DUF1376 family)
MNPVGVWMPLYIGEYMADTGHLTTEQHGSYVLLLMHCWRTGRLPRDHAQLAALCRMSRTKFEHRVAQVVLAFFVVDGDTLRHSRLDEERAAAIARNKKQRENITKRWTNPEPKTSQRDPDVSCDISDLGDTDVYTKPIPNAYSSPSPSSKEEERKKETRRSPTAPSVDTDLLGDAQEDLMPGARVAKMLVIDDTPQAVAMWNDMAATTGLPKVQRLSDDRHRRLRQRLKECGGLDGWSHAMEQVAGSPFLLGQVGQRDWSADFDFLLQPSSFTKLMEGGFSKPKAKTNRDIWDEAAKMFGVEGEA